VKQFTFAQKLRGATWTKAIAAGIEGEADCDLFTGLDIMPKPPLLLMCSKLGKSRSRRRKRKRRAKATRGSKSLHVRADLRSWKVTQW
jgi:hypothetical protein